ncbi:metalloprotease PmbA [Thioalkalivibrio denitrificans]|uniref:Metalloprotease PmbA n=1 Tax=Thioalkalivibrio denitrificans TaxID=108003 RepID=A0A1V3NMA9_9GAMM|nr:metalloprotease PmbA [Thioalkalivibrio denitrificans]OOG25896.1 metalloprotease PmbA [Thioalkalivibrio denitrificans]
MTAIQELPRDQQTMERIVEQMLDEARKSGAESAEAAASNDLGLSVNVRLGEVETLEHHKDQGVAITVYFGRRKGTASTSDLRPEALREAVQAACRIARYTAEDPYAGLADPALMARDWPDLDLDHPWDLSVEQAIELAQCCEAAARNHDARIINSEGASANTVRGLVVYGNTHGFLGAYTTTRHSLSCSVVAADDKGMQRDYWYTVSRDPAGLQAPDAVGLEAARRAVRRLGGRRLSTRQCAALYVPEMARSLIGHFVGAVRGGALYRKASFLVDALEQDIFPSFVRIHEQPHLKGALGSLPFDSEGVATTPRDVVSGGVLKGYVLDSYSARRLGMTTTGNAGGVHNLTIEPGDLDLDGLLRSMGSGLLVTELIGHGINLVTGDYSRGAAGFWVENGEIAWPVEEITVAGNLRDLFKGIRAVGSDVNTDSNIRTGSLLLERVTVAGE